MNRLIILTLLSCLLFLSSCSNTPKADAQSSMESVELPEDFLDFLDEFHTNIEFQKEHIQWPLQGLPPMMDDADATLDVNTYRWTAEDWVMHKGFDENNEEFELNYAIMGEDLIQEYIIHINGSMGMERRFAKMDDEWKLIYYAGMNLIKK